MRPRLGRRTPITNACLPVQAALRGVLGASATSDPTNASPLSSHRQLEGNETERIASSPPYQPPSPAPDDRERLTERLIVANILGDP
jgi:hypothetical protein